MIKQRKTKNLGINRSLDKPKIYTYIEKILGIKKKYCSRGSSNKKSKYAVVHEGPNPLPINNFNILGAFVDSKGNVIIKKKPGLQPYCIACERKYRRGRLSKWHGKYKKMSEKEIYDEYKKNYGSTSHCSYCSKDKAPEDFPVSRKMDKGLHNVCKACSKSYAEAVGDRWIIYSPDGKGKILKIKQGKKCRNCGAEKNLHLDHFWPISKGGTDNRENHQMLCKEHNLEKSDKISSEIKSIHDIKEEMICTRYRDLLKKAKKENWPIKRFELEIAKEVRKFIIRKSQLNNAELKDFFESEKQRNNRKHSPSRSVRKFREYASKANIKGATADT